MVNLLSGRCGCPAVSTHRETLRARSIVNRIEVPVVGMPYAEAAARHVAPLYLAFAAPVLDKLDVDEVKISWSSEVCDRLSLLPSSESAGRNKEPVGQTYPFFVAEWAFGLVLSGIDRRDKGPTILVWTDAKASRFLRLDRKSVV